MNVLKSFIFKLQNPSQARIQELQTVLANNKFSSEVYKKTNGEQILVIDGNPYGGLPGRYLGNLLSAHKQLVDLGETYNHVSNLYGAMGAAKAGLVENPLEIKNLYEKEREANYHYELAIWNERTCDFDGRYDRKKDESRDIDQSYFKALAASARAKFQSLENSAPTIDLQANELSQTVFLSEKEVQQRVTGYIDQLIQRGFSKDDVEKLPHDLLASIPPHLINSVTIADSNYFWLRPTDDPIFDPINQKVLFQDGLKSRAKIAYDHQLESFFTKLGITTAKSNQVDSNQDYIIYEKDSESNGIKSITIATASDEDINRIKATLENSQEFKIIRDGDLIKIETPLESIPVNFVKGYSTISAKPSELISIGTGAGSYRNVRFRPNKTY